MPVAAAVVIARVVADREGCKGCHPDRLRLTDPSTILAAAAPQRAPNSTCMKQSQPLNAMCV